MSYKVPLEINCHVKPGADAVVTVTVDNVPYTVTLSPTIDWVASSTKEESHRVLVLLEMPDTVLTNVVDKTFKFKIKAEHSDVLVCGYNPIKGGFTITSQPVWDAAHWRPYDIAGHGSDEDMYSGPGSLQILAGQTVEFDGTLSGYQHFTRRFEAN